MAESLGTIYYDVDANLDPLLGKMRQAESALGGLGSETKKADQAVGRFNTKTTETARAVSRANSEIRSQSSAMSSLTKIVGAYLSLRTIQAVISMSDEYGQMSSRIKAATQDTEEYVKVQDRLLATANGTYRSLSEAQEVYLSTSGVLKDLGYNTEQVLDITDSLSYAFTRDATRTDQARSAMDAYSKALAKGRIDADAWISITANTPSIVDGITEATGRSAAEIRRLGVEGKLSLEALNEGLRRSRDTNVQATDDMATSVEDAVIRLRNSLQNFIGRVNESSEASGLLTDSIDELSNILQDPATIQAAQEMATAIVTAMGGIVKGAREVVAITRWMAEEVAATFNGIAGDDVIRLEAEADKIRKTLEGGISGLGERLRFFGPDGVVKFWSRAELEAELARIEKAVDESNKRMRANLPTPTEAPTPTSTDRPALVDAETKATDRLTASRKRLTDAERALQRAEQERQRGTERNAEVVARLEEQIRQTTLAADDLAARQAELSLNDYATPEQVEQVRALARELYAAQQEAALLEQRRSAFTGDAAGAIRGQVSPLSGGAFDDQAARYEAEAAAEQERYALQLERLREAKELEIEVIGGYQALEEQMAQEHADRLMQIEEARVQAMAAQSAAAFGAMASDLQAFAQTFGAENSKMMAIAKAAAIAQTIMETYAGAQKAFSALAGIPIVGPALGTAAAAAAIAGGMARVAQIRGTSGRLAGGPVNASSMYRVNENGAPEVFSAANGQQFMIPNQRGEVISNRNATAGGAGVVINIHNAPQGTVAESSQDQDGQQMIDIWVADFMADGRTASAVQGKFGLSPQGR